jgi:hypothetical protein
MDTEVKSLERRKIRSSSRIMGHPIPNGERKEEFFGQCGDCMRTELEVKLSLCSHVCYHPEQLGR